MFLDIVSANIGKKTIGCIICWLINIKRRQIFLLATFIKDKYRVFVDVYFMTSFLPSLI